MKYESVKYSKKPNPPVSKELAAVMPPEMRRAYALVRYSGPMAAMLTELVDADVLPEKYHMRVARLVASLLKDTRQPPVRKG